MKDIQIFRRGEEMYFKSEIIIQSYSSDVLWILTKINYTFHAQ